MLFLFWVNIYNNIKKLPVNRVILLVNFWLILTKDNSKFLKFYSNLYIEFLGPALSILSGMYQVPSMSTILN